MATAFRNTTFQTVWTLLSGNITGVTLYDHVPTNAAGAPTANMPYAILSNSDTRAWEHDDKKGSEIEMTLNVFSDALGRNEVDTALDEAFALIDRATLTATGYIFVDCLVSFSSVDVLEDGKTRMGTMRFTIQVQED